VAVALVIESNRPCDRLPRLLETTELIGPDRFLLQGSDESFRLRVSPGIVIGREDLIDSQGLAFRPITPRGRRLRCHPQARPAPLSAGLAAANAVHSGGNGVHTSDAGRTAFALGAEIEAAATR